MNARQSTLSRFLKKTENGDSEEVSVYLPTPDKTAASERYEWTRVKSLKKMKNNRYQLFDVANDLQWDKNLQKIRNGITRDLGEMLFDPDNYKGKGDVLTFKRQRLDEQSLLKYARKATSLRAVFKQKAASIKQNAN